MTKDTATKEDMPIDTATCPDKPTHRLKLGQTCATCGTAIPSLPGYTPSEYTLWFAPPTAETTQYVSPEEQEYLTDNAARWERYAELDAHRVALTFAIEEAKQKRYGIRGSSRFVDAGGNEQVDASVHVRGAAADASIAELEERRRKAEEEEQAHMRETIKRDSVQAARRRAQLLAESFPEPARSRGIVERIGDTLRGS